MYATNTGRRSGSCCDKTDGAAACGPVRVRRTGAGYLQDATLHGVGTGRSRQTRPKNTRSQP